MEIAANNNGTVSVFRRSVKLTVKGIHLGVVGDFYSPRVGKSEVYVWSRLKRNSRPKSLLKVIFRMGSI